MWQNHVGIGPLILATWQRPKHDMCYTCCFLSTASLSRSFPALSFVAKLPMVLPLSSAPPPILLSRTASPLSFPTPKMAARAQDVAALSVEGVAASALSFPTPEMAVQAHDVLALLSGTASPLSFPTPEMTARAHGVAALSVEGAAASPLSFPMPEMDARAHGVAALSVKGAAAAVLNFRDLAAFLPRPATLSPRDIQAAAAARTAARSAGFLVEEEGMEGGSEVVVVEEEEEEKEAAVATSPRPMAEMDGVAAPPFLMKTFEMVEDRETDGVVSWNRDRNSFVVWDPHRFSTALLPKYFKHSSFSGFILQRTPALFSFDLKNAPGSSFSRRPLKEGTEGQATFMNALAKIYSIPLRQTLACKKPSERDGGWGMI